MNQNSPKVSIIVPIYGVEQYIRCCADSLFRQTYENIEFIFVDDGSPDHSIDILKQVLEEFPSRKDQVKILHEPNKGLPQARMTGLREASGEWIIHVDSDDWVEPDYISLLLETALRENADVAYCDFIKEKDNGTSLGIEAEFSPSDGKRALKAMHNSDIRAYMWNKLIHRSLYYLDSMLVPMYGFHEDIVFQTQILYGARKCVHVAKPLYHYRRFRKGALTSLSLLKSRKQSTINMLNLYDYLPAKGSAKEVCGIDIALRGGWYSAIIFKWGLLASHPDVVDTLADMKLLKNYRMPLYKQYYAKVVCQILRSVRKIKILKAISKAITAGV